MFEGSSNAISYQSYILIVNKTGDKFLREFWDTLDIFSMPLSKNVAFACHGERDPPTGMASDPLGTFPDVPALPFWMAGSSTLSLALEMDITMKCAVLMYTSPTRAFLSPVCSAVGTQQRNPGLEFLEQWSLLIHALHLSIPPTPINGASKAIGG